MANTKSSPLGFSAQDILQMVEVSEGTVPAYWPLATLEHESDANIFLSWTEALADESTEAELHLEVTPRGSKSTYFEASDEYGCEVERLEIPVDVAFELENDEGTLRTQFEGVLLAPNAELAVLNVFVEADKLRGDPQLSLQDGETFEYVELALQFTSNGMSGGVTTWVSSDSESGSGDEPTDDEGSGFEVLATWPLSNPCLDHLPVLFGEQLGAVDPSAAIERLEQGAVVYWEDGTSSLMTVSFETPRQAACFEIPPFGYEDPSNLWAVSGATLGVKSADGRWDATYAGVQVEMSWAYSGDRAATHLRYNAAATQQQLEQLGFAGLDLNGEKAELSLGMLVEGDNLEGVVQVTIADDSGTGCEDFEPCETTLVLGKIGDPKAPRGAD